MAPHSSTLAWKIPWKEEPWWAAVHRVAKSRTRLSDFPFTFHFPASEKEMATHSTILAWRIPGTAEPGGLPSMGSHRVGHDWSDLAAAAAALTILLLKEFTIYLTSTAIKTKFKIDADNTQRIVGHKDQSLHLFIFCWSKRMITPSHQVFDVALWRQHAKWT